MGQLNEGFILMELTIVAISMLIGFEGFPNAPKGAMFVSWILINSLLLFGWGIFG